MAGNIGDICCWFCSGQVRLDNDYDAYGPETTYAPATCIVCKAKYNAISPQVPFRDLNFRSSHRNEPHEEDLPQVEPWKSKYKAIYGSK